MQKVKIIRNIARLNVGGPANHCLWLLDLDKNFNYHTSLLTGQVGLDEQSVKIDSSHLDNISFIPTLSRNISFGDFYNFIKTFTYILKKKPHIVHSHTSKAGIHARLAVGVINLFRFLSRRKRIKVIHTFHGNVFSGYFNTLFNKIIILIERFFAKFLSDAIVVISQEQFNDICFKYKVSRPIKTHIIPLGLPIEKKGEVNRDFSFRNAFSIKLNTKIVGIISRLTRIKNHQLFIHICEKYVETYHDNTIFMIIGDGDLEYKNELVQLIKKKNLTSTVIFTGMRFDLQNIYNCIDLLALTSLNEGTPLSILEAMVKEVPCISTPVGGVPDLLSNNRGILAADVPRFVLGINKLLYDKAFRLSVTRNALDYVERNHSKNNLLSNINDLYTKILNSQ